MIACETCGKAVRVLVYRWREYHRVQARLLVCIKCADVHDMSLRGQANG